MKKGVLICLVFYLVMISFVGASNVGLIENVTWQQNLTSSRYIYYGATVLGDIDNDGDLDMIAIGCDSGSGSTTCTASEISRVYINNGTSFIENIVWQSNLSNISSGSLALGDVNNDGNLDLVLSGIGTRIYINNGTAFYENSTWQTRALLDEPTISDSGSVALGDIDNDGDLDLVFPGMGTTRAFWINNGTSFVNNSIWSQGIIDDVGKLSTGLADFDNDGDLDLNIFGDGSGRTYINNGTSFVNVPAFSIPGGDEASIAWGDINNDGYIDHISSTFSSIVIGINNGSEFAGNDLWNTNEMDTLAWGSMMLGDIDNDGDLDLVNAGNSGGSYVRIGENNGTAFLSDLSAEANLTGMRDGPVTFGDIDNDGDLDLIVIKSQKIYINNITTPNVAPTSPDGFSYSYNNREISLGWNNGSDNETPTLGLYYNLKLGTASNNHSVISGVYGGSGDSVRGGTNFGYYGNMMQRKNFTLKVDRLEPLTTYYWSVQTIDTGLQAGNWSTAQSFTTQADLSRPDITLNSPVATANLSSYSVVFNVTVTDNLNLSNVSLWGNWGDGWSRKQINSSGLNNTEYIFTEYIPSQQTFQWYIEAEDNATNIINSSIRTFTIDVSVGLIEDETWQSNLIASNYHNGAVLGDIDNDGDLDMIAIGCDSGSSICTVADTSYVWINNGTSFIENSTWQQNLSNVGYGSLALGDIDNDGDLELVLSAIDGGGTKIYINNGTSFIENSTWQINLMNSLAGADSNSVALGDIDNDGDLDLVFPGMEPNRVFWINNGTSFVNNSLWGQGIIDDTGKISTGLVDFDNDGDLDLNVLGSTSAKTYINNGTSFIYNVNWSFSSRDEGNVAWGDIDNDGDFESIVSGPGGSSMSFWVYNGIFFDDNSSSWNLDLSNLGWGSMMLGDYDNNGYLDLMSTGMSSIDKIQIGANNGSLFAQDVTAQANLSSVRKGSVLWGDIDNDGDLDLVSIKNQKVYINNNTVSNNVSISPTSFSYSYNNREISLGWNNGSDDETGTLGLYYNLKLGTASNNHSVISGVYGGQGDATRGGTAFGYYGNMMQRKNFTLKVDRLEPSTTYYWSVQTIDTGLQAGNWSTAQSFTTQADLSRPDITLNSPVAGANLSSYTVTFNATITDNLNLSNVSLWGNWTGTFQINETNSSGLNNSNYVFTKDLSGYGDGTYSWMIQAEDNATNIENSTTLTFTIDTISPSIVIVSPVTNANLSDTGLDINYTVSDSGVGLDSCWYSNDTYTVNTSITCGTNITALTWDQGFHNVTVWANDSLGNENSSSVNFTIDSINPVVIMLSPINGTNSSDAGLDINYSVSDSGVGLDSCWYSNDTYTVNTSIICGTNITTLTWDDGVHNVTVWANDSAGNEGENSTTFTIDATGPTVVIVSPVNGTNSSDVGLNVTYTALDSGVGLDSCWYSNGTYTVNTSVSCGTNITSLTWVDFVTHNVTIWANDTLGNEGEDIVFFTINTTDVTSPNITLLSPAGGASYTSSSQQVSFSFNISEKNEIANCSLIIGGGVNLTNASVDKLVTQNFTQTFTPVTYSWNINCTDTNNNVGNSTARSFTVTAPVVDDSDGSSSSSGGGSFVVTYTANESELEKGYSRNLGEGDKMSFTVGGGSHSLEIKSIINNIVNITLNSEPINFLISVGEELKFDLNNNSFYDLLVKLNSIVGSRANLTITEINKSYGGELDNIEVNESDEGDVSDEDDESSDLDNNIKYWIYVGLALIIICGVGGLIWLRIKGFFYKK